MTQQQVAERRGQIANKPPIAAKSLEPDVQCIHRSWSAVGKVKCGCASSPEVFTCGEPWVVSGYCVRRDPIPGQFPPDGPILLHDGTKVIPNDDRNKVFVVWNIRKETNTRPSEVIVCTTCPYRVDPPPHIVRLQRLGIRGNYDPDTGHADIVHCVTQTAAWSSHLADWVACGQMPAVSVCADKPTDLAAIIEATTCRLMVLHTSWCNHNSIGEAAERFPGVKFWGVLHGSQNSMIMSNDWAHLQSDMLKLSERLPNVWYGTPEPTVPFASMGFDRYIPWVNTLADDSVFDPRVPDPSPVTLLIAGRGENIKGMPVAVMAAGIVNQTRPVKLLACVKDNIAPLKFLAASVGVPFESKGFLTLQAFRAFVRQSVSIMLDPSLTDAWQYTGLDVLSQGRPVVGSQTIRYLPREWQADPNDPADIARVALMFMDDYERYSADALRLGREISDRQREAYHRTLERILV